MLPVGFEPTISAGERPHTYALDRAATGNGIYIYIHTHYVIHYVYTYVIYVLLTYVHTYVIKNDCSGFKNLSYTIYLR